MRRRLMDVGKLKRLPLRKSRVTEPVQTNSYYHWKVVMGSLFLMVLDSTVNFRLEYLYPILMFVRSVYDSYKYQGFVFSLLFILLVVYLDLLCWTVLTVPWLFVGASTCVWLEMTRILDHGITFSAAVLAALFLYLEISSRLSADGYNMVNISRPFAAHCIGYPVVTMSFLIKHHITHIIRQHQQKKVLEENSVYFDVLQKALPRPLSEDREEGMVEGALGETENTSGMVVGNGVVENTGGKKISPKASSLPSNSGSNSHRPHKTSTSSSSSSNPSYSSTSLGSGNSRHRINGIKSLVQDTKLLKDLSLDLSASGSTVITANGDLNSLDGSRPLSAGCNKMHLSSGRRQSLVRTSPRLEQSSSPTSDLAHKMQKTRQAMELMNVDLKDERHAKLELQSTVGQLELEVKKLKADLHASCLQEEETSSRVNQLQNLERIHKNELQRLRNENENLQNKFNKCTSSRQQDQATVSDLDKKLKGEIELRTRVESELRNHQNASRNSYSAEEVKQLNDKLRKMEKELDCTRKELAKKDKTCENLKKDLACQCMSLCSVEGDKQTLNVALADETRVKIELFTALSEARRKHQSLLEDYHRKNTEISQLKQGLAEVMAIIPTPQPPTTSMGSIPVPYPPASSPQH